MSDDRLLKTKEVAALLGIHYKTVYASAALMAIRRDLQLHDDPTPQPQHRWLESEVLATVAARATGEAGNAPTPGDAAAGADGGNARQASARPKPAPLPDGVPLIPIRRRTRR